MRDYKCFMESLMNGNTEGVSNNISEEFVNIIVEKGKFPIHVACEKGLINIVQLLMQHGCNIECEDLEEWRPIHYASMNGHLEVVRLLIEYNCNIESGTSVKSRPIHCACRNGHVEVVKLLLDNNGNIECETEGQWRPIHDSSWNGNLEIVRLLLGHNCNIECETNAKWRPIHCAIRNGHAAVVRLLIDQNCDIESEDDEQLRPIHCAISKGHADVARLLIDHNCNIESEDDNRWRPIHYASWNGFVEIVTNLIESNCDIECVDDTGAKPIHYASYKGHADVVRLLIDQNCDIECETNAGAKPIHYASCKGHADVVRLLLDQNCNIECEDKRGWRPIHDAVSNGYANVLKLLIDRNCNLEFEDNEGSTLIHWASWNGHVEIARLLLVRNCNIECEDIEGRRPIHYALINDHIDIVKLLLGQNCDIECEDNEKKRPIHYASCKGHADVVKLLLVQNCDIECEDNEKKRPIHDSASNGHIDVVRLLLGQNCNIECEDNEGWRPIHYASCKGYADVVRLLLSQNCFIECKDNEGWRPIHDALSNDHLDVVKLLIGQNCDIECEDNEGRRPIHYAAIKGHIDVVRLLLGRNCDIECQTNAGRRPIHEAVSNGHIGIVRLLIGQNCNVKCENKENGLSPLELARLCDQKDCVELLSNSETLLKTFAAVKRNDPIEFEELYKSCNFISRNFYTGFCFLKIALENNADRIIKNILDKPIDNKEIDDFMKEISANNIENSNLIKECLLHRCIIHKHVVGFKQLKTAAIINGNREIMQTSFLEMAAEQGCHVFIDEIMKKTIYDKSVWIKAMDKARENGFLNIEEEISDRMILLESRQKVNFTILHTAICDNDPDVVKYILDHADIVDLNSNNEIFGTALAFSHSLHHSKCIKIMQQYQLDTNTRNKFMQTPLHEAIASGVEKNCGFLIDRAVNIDQTDFMGLSVLHCAVIRGMINVSSRLVTKGADYVKYVQLSPQSSSNNIAIPFAKSTISLSHTENALTLSIKFQATLLPCFLERLNSESANSCDGDENSLLHMAVKCLQPGLCRSLVNAGAQIHSINNLGNTPLLEMFYETEINMTDELNKMIDITNILIECGADVNAKSSNEISLFQSASIIGSERLMLALVSNNPMLRNFSSDDFQLAFSNQWHKYGETLIKILPDNFLSSNITIETFQSSKKAEPKLIKILFDKSSPELQQSILENFLYEASNNDGNEIFDHMINIEILQPSELRNGETLLTALMKENKIGFVWKLLDSINKTKFVNVKNKRNQTALQVAIEIEEMDLIDNLIYESEGFDSEDKDGRTALTQLLEKISICTNANSNRKLISAIKSIVQAGGDIYMVTSLGKQVIDACADGNVKTDVIEFNRKILTKSKKLVKKRPICNICMDNLVEIVLQCGHLLCCRCSDQLFVCHACNAEITTRIQLYFN